MYCRFCGKQIPDDSIYCPACGKLLDSGKQTNTEAPVPAEPAPTQTDINQLMKDRGITSINLSYADEQPANNGGWNIRGSEVALDTSLAKEAAHPASAGPESTLSSNPPAKLGMKWYKFLIYFSLLIGFIFNFLSGLGYISGVIYMTTTDGQITAEQVYNLYGPVLHASDIIFGFALIAMAIFAITVRSKLADFDSNAPSCFYAYLTTDIVLGVLYHLAVLIITGENVMISQIGNWIVAFLYLLANVRYFSRRMHLFTSK